MDEYLHFNNAIFVQEIVIFVIFCSNLSLLIISTLCLNLMINITPGGLFSGRGGLYTEGVCRFKSWFLNAPEFIHGGAYYRNFTHT